MPNGNDFWWDGFTSNRWNCWYGNTGPDGKAGSVTGPGAAGTLAGHVPERAAQLLQRHEPGLQRRAWAIRPRPQYLVDCSNGPDTDTGPLDCDWWSVRPEPGSAAAQARAAEFSAAARKFNASPQGVRLARKMAALSGE